MALYKPGRSRKEVIEGILRDLDPSLRDLARSILENMRLEELAELKSEDLLRILEEKRKLSKQK
ncbi:MAG: hypothetical protein OWQ48_03160 [Desulfurococcus sp.]|nr:hypothetical protein [Desulfurococcus sp.]